MTVCHNRGRLESCRAGAFSRLPGLDWWPQPTFLSLSGSGDNCQSLGYYTLHTPSQYLLLWRRCLSVNYCEQSECFPLPSAEQVRNIFHIVARHSSPAIPPHRTEMKHFLTELFSDVDTYRENLNSAGIKELIRDPGGNILSGDRPCVFIAPLISVGPSSLDSGGALCPPQSTLITWNLFAPPGLRGVDMFVLLLDHHHHLLPGSACFLNHTRPLLRILLALWYHRIPG